MHSFASINVNGEVCELSRLFMGHKILNHSCIGDGKIE